MNEEPILAGAEPFFFRGNDIGVLVCHGFTGSTQSMRYLGESLHRAGYTVIGPRLRGHGVSPQAMGRTTASDWIASVEEALATLRETCTQIYMTGLSMGGTLTLYMAAMHPDVILGAVPINATVGIGNADLAALVFDPAAPETVPGIGSDIKAPGVKELAYPDVPVAALRHLFALVGVTNALLPRIKCPTLVIQAHDDHVVEPSNGPRIVQTIGSARVELQWLSESYHVATLDNDKDAICTSTIAFIRSIAGR